jgi:dihydroflavonol-4-reductase
VRVLVTGASGFIGSHVAAELAARGAKVRAFCRTEPRVADWVQGDVRDAAAVARAVEGCEAVVHAAALYSYRRSDAGLMEAVNVEGTRNVVESALRAGVGRVLVTSSSATCGPVRGRPATELDRPPAWELRVPYKRSKLQAERLALAAGAVCVNPTTVVGPGDRAPTPSGKMIRDLVEGRMHGYLRGAGLNVVAVEDVARGHALALERGRPGERYILGGEDVWLRDAFALALAALGRKPPRLPVPWVGAYGAALVAGAAGRLVGREPRLLVLDEVRLARLPLFFSCDKAGAELGYVPGAAADALATAARWFARRATSTTRSAASGRLSVLSGSGR